MRAPRLFRYNPDTGLYQEEPAAVEGGYNLATAGADEVLVSARQHEIDEIRPGVADAQELTGIGYMKMGLDFIVDEDESAPA